MVMFAFFAAFPRIPRAFAEVTNSSRRSEVGHVPSVESGPEAWVLLVTGRLVKTLFVNQITMEKSFTGT